MSPSSFKFEQILKEAGSAGRWQWAFAIFTMISVRQSFMVFLQYGEMAANGFCKQPDLEAKNWTLRQQRLYSSPDTRTCAYYNFTYSEVPDNYTLAMMTRRSDLANVSKLYCTADNGWQPETSDARYRKPTSSQFGIVCERRWLRPIAGVLHMLGNFVGLLVSGPLSDHFGRRKCLLIFGYSMCIIGPLVSVSPNYIVYIILRILAAFVFMPWLTINWVLLTEIFGNKSRVLLRVIWSCVWHIAVLFFVLFSYLLQNWRLLHLSLNIPSFLVIFAWWVIPESPRWLLSKGRYAESLKGLQRIASYNGRQLSKETVEQFEALEKGGEFLLNEEGNKDQNNKSDNENTNKPLGYLTLLRTKELKKRTLICSYTWFACGLCAYAFAFGNVKLPGNPYLNGMVNGAVGLLIMPIHYVMLILLGRKKCLIVGFTIVCIFSACTAVFMALPHKSLRLASIVVATIGKAGVDIAFSTVYLYSAELFPTVVRNMAFNSGSSSARIGAACAPVIAILDAWVWSSLPAIIIASFALIAAVMILIFLPDTTGKPMLQTIEELETQNVQENTEDI